MGASNDQGEGVSDFVKPDEIFRLFANRHLPIRQMEYAIDGRFFSHNGVSPKGQLSFQASFQTNTFYIKGLSRIQNGNVYQATDGPIWGRSYIGSWIVKGGVKYVSLAIPQGAGDPVNDEVATYLQSAEPVLGLGLTPPVSPGSLVWNNQKELEGQLSDGTSVAIGVQRDSLGRIERTSFEVDFDSKSRLKRTVHYSYNREQFGVPSGIAVTNYIGEAKNARLISWKCAIRRCEVGETQMEVNGYAPEAFIPQQQGIQRSAYFSNGIAYRVDGLVTSVVRNASPPASMSQGPRPGTSGAARLAILAAFLGTSLLWLWVSFRKRKQWR